MISYVPTWLATILQIFGILNHNGEETPAPVQQSEQIPPPAMTESPATTESPPPIFSASSGSRSPRRQHSSRSLNIAPPHPKNLAAPAPYLMDPLSWAALAYCFTAGLEFNAIVAQAADPNDVSFRIQLMSLLLNVALCLLIAANGIYARTHPRMAFWIDRVGSVIVLISSTIAALPSFPVYVSIGCAGFMIILYAHQSFSSRVFYQPCKKKEQGETENSESELDSV